MYPVIKKKLCSHCGICIDVCPSDVFIMEEGLPVVKVPEECIECSACVDNCPTNAVYLDD